MTPEQALAGAGYQLPDPHPVVGSFALTTRCDRLVYVSGHGCFEDGKPACTGKVGSAVDVASGRYAAERVMLSLLSTVQAELGSLSAVRRFLKLLVFVNSTPDFTEQHLVANGATDLLDLAFAGAPRPTRSAIGVAALPLDFTVEIEAVLELS